jgi:hypothetical protein
MRSTHLSLLAAIGLVLGGCGAGGSEEDQNAKVLNAGDAVKGPSQSDCSDSFVLDAVNALCELFGAGSCISQQSSCNSYARQLYTGSSLSADGTYWNGRGNSGEQMADASLCILRELSPKVQGGGPITSSSSIDLGIGSVKVRQEVGYLDFDRLNARFQGYRKISVELPVLGKFDAVTQNIDLQKAQYGGHSFNPYPFAGDYQILFGFGLNLNTEEKFKTLSVTPPAFDVATPIGVFSAQPAFEYQSYATVADAPFGSNHTYVLLPPDGDGEVALDLADLYGILPGVANTARPTPTSLNYKEFRGGWISQIGMGNRGTGTGSESVWSPPASGTFSRPDYDPTGTLDFVSYVPRSIKENQPSVHAKASAKLTYPEDPYALLPSWVHSLPGVSVTAYIQVSPTIEAGAAGQFGIVLSEGTNYERQGEFDVNHERLAALGIYSGVKTNASFYIDTLLRIKVDASFSTPFGDLDVNFIDINPHFPIPLAGGTPAASSMTFASAYSSSSVNEMPAIHEPLDSLNTFNAAKPNPEDFITQCYAPENEIPSEAPPTPTSEKGDPADLFESEVWPCNICLAADEVKDAGGAVLESAHSDFMMPAKTLPTTWRCDSRGKSGCMDKCIWDKTFDEDGKPNLTVIAGPGDIADGIPTTDPQHDFFKACLVPCGAFVGTVPGPPCIEDSTAPELVFVSTNELTSVSVDTTISATFSKQMDPNTINTNTFTVAVGGRPIGGTITYDRVTYTATFSPDSLLAYDTTYTVTITIGVRDLAGIPLLTESSSTFTTEPAR